MSTVLWIKLENDPEDFASDDLYHLYHDLDALDEQCRQAGVTPLSEFVDNSDLQYNLSDEDLGEDWLEANAVWLEPAPLLETLAALEGALAGKEDQEEVLEEIRHVIVRCNDAQSQSVQVRLLAVM